MDGTLMRDATGRSGWGCVAAIALALAIGLPACSQSKKDVKADAAVEHAKLDFTVKDMNGREVHLADFKGRPVLVNFWATWCGPCKQEIPSLIELADRYKDEHLAVLGISVDDSAEELQKYASEHRMNYPVLIGLGHDDLLEAYDAQFGVPVSWFVRPDGTVMTKHSGTESKAWFESQVKALFEKAGPA